ncbi:MAG TPA: PaaI family thioesterase [Xanthobacteraceae bacterium]|nr:PaaI family thioesterase [Xanthobacteraceae bacterium]
MELDDDAIRTALGDRAKHPPSARLLGFELIDFSVEGGWAEVAFTPRPEFANPAGTVQGGFICAMLDDAMAVAATVSRRLSIIVPTLQMSITYLRPTPIARVIARGEVLRFGTSSVALHGVLRDAGGAALAIATATAVPRPFPG